MNIFGYESDKSSQIDNTMEIDNTLKASFNDWSYILQDLKWK